MKRALQLRWLAGTLVLALVTVLLVTGCGGKKHASGTAIVGWAIAGHPLVGADVRIIDLQGHEIGKAIEPTLQRGLFAARVKNLPKDFLVVATGGTDGGKPFTGELRDDVRGYVPLHTLVVGPASTLISFYASGKGLSHREAASRVHDYLGLPAAIDVERDLRASDNKWFSSLTFERAAAGKGGTDAYLHRLAKEVDHRATRTFPAAPTNGVEATAADAAINDVLGGLATGAAKQAGGWAFGDVLNLIGAGSQDSAALNQISSELAAIESSLQIVQTDLQSLSTAVGSLTYASDIAGIDAWMNNNGLGTADPSCVNDQGSSNCLFDNYAAVVDAAQSNDADTANAASAVFQNSVGAIAGTSANGIKALEQQLNAIDGSMQVSNTHTSALSDWAHNFIQTYRYWNSDTQNSYRYPFVYWAGIESEIAVMIQEYTSANNLTADPLIPNLVPSETSPILTKWQTQGRLLGMQAIPLYMLVDTATKNMWPEDLTKMYQPGGPVAASWETAVDATVPTWLAQYLPAGFTYRMPSNADFVGLVSPASGFPQSWGASGDVANYLASLGFQDALPWFWVSDSSTVPGFSAGDTTEYHYGFSMNQGDFSQACGIPLFNGSPIGSCSDTASTPSMYVTAVATISETPSAWYVTPPPSS